MNQEDNMGKKESRTIVSLVYVGLMISRICPIFGFACVVAGIIAALLSQIPTAAFFAIGGCICALHYYISERFIAELSTEGRR